MLHVSGFELLEANFEFNEQYMWIVARAVDKKLNTIQAKNGSYVLEPCRSFSKNREKKIDSIQRLMQDLSQKQMPLFVWGAGAKGVTFVNIFDLEKQYISALIDINRGKQNKYVGKTGHKVIAPENLKTNYCMGGGV
jgi:hypothetical protein